MGDGENSHKATQDGIGKAGYCYRVAGVEPHQRNLLHRERRGVGRMRVKPEQGRVERMPKLYTCEKAGRGQEEQTSFQT